MYKLTLTDLDTGKTEVDVEVEALIGCTIEKEYPNPDGSGNILCKGANIIFGETSTEDILRTAKRIQDIGMKYLMEGEKHECCGDDNCGEQCKCHDSGE